MCLVNLASRRVAEVHSCHTHVKRHQRPSIEQNGPSKRDLHALNAQHSKLNPQPVPRTPNPPSSVLTSLWASHDRHQVQYPTHIPYALPPVPYALPPVPRTAQPSIFSPHFSTQYPTHIPYALPSVPYALPPMHYACTLRPSTYALRPSTYTLRLKPKTYRYSHTVASKIEGNGVRAPEAVVHDLFQH